MQEQIAAAGGTPEGGRAARPKAPSATTGASTTAAGTGSVTIRVFACPAELSQERARPGMAALLAACTPLDAPEVAPTLIDISESDGEPMAGTWTELGVYQWDDVAFGDYAVGGSGDEMPARPGPAMRVMDASGAHAAESRPPPRRDVTAGGVPLLLFPRLGDLNTLRRAATDVAARTAED